MHITVRNHYVEAWENNSRIGCLVFDYDGFIEDITVSKEYRRKGIATKMWQAGLDGGYKLKHSDRRSPAGDAWAKRVGGDLPVNKYDEPWD